MSTYDYMYRDLCRYILEDGAVKGTRNGRTKSIFGHQIRHSMHRGFPLLTTKKMPFKAIVAELTWFLKGRTDIGYLHERGCHIWDADYDKHGKLGPIYGKQWRDWYGIDQIDRLVATLKTDPDSRRMVVSAWNVEELDRMAVPPCHHSFQVYTTEGLHGKRHLHLMWNQRSVDVPLGLPFNVASYALLLMILAKEVDMVPGWLIGSLGDCHIYQNQAEGIEEQIDRYPNPKLPRVEFDKKEIHEYDVEDFRLVDYDSHPAIKIPLSV